MDAHVNDRTNMQIKKKLKIKIKKKKKKKMEVIHAPMHQQILQGNGKITLELERE